MTEVSVQRRVAGDRWRAMRPRAVDERHRAATPLELLFDLTLVVAVAQVAAELAHGIAADHAAEALLGYVTMFFAIWWAWMNFTWFASAYDCDDAAYRLLTLLQMSGVLVLAAGVPAAFEDKDFRTATFGYVIMRVAMLLQWLRAAASDAERRGTALRFVTGVGLVQICWLVRLALPEGIGLATFFVLVVAELAVPLWAERHGMTPWHPHHIAERYGLFTIIVLGECVLAATTAVRATSAEDGLTVDLFVVAGGSLLLLFVLWWIYFLKDAGRGLERKRHLGFWWGYGHYVVFASLAALGAGLEVAAESVAHDIDASDPLVGFAMAVPVAGYLMVVWALHAPLGAAPRRSFGHVSAAAVASLLVAALVPIGLPVGWVAVLLCVPPAVLVVLHRTSPGTEAAASRDVLSGGAD